MMVEFSTQVIWGEKFDGSCKQGNQQAPTDSAIASESPRDRMGLDVDEQGGQIGMPWIGA